MRTKIFVLLVIAAVSLGSFLYYQTRGVGLNPVTQSQDETASGNSAGGSDEATQAARTRSDKNPVLTPDENGLSQATVVITTEKGDIKFKFYSKDAPNTTARIIELINDGFYDGLTFHRVIEGFVIQGGDPKGNGTGGSGQNLNAEFNARPHIPGTVAMARARDVNSADSQFYISLGTHPHLDKNYTVFGQVVEGMEVAKKIAVGDKMVHVVIE